METQQVAGLAESLEGLGVTTERATPSTLSAALTDAVEPPAVGVPLPFAPDALEDAGVASDPSPSELEAAATGVTPARFAIAETGTLAIPSTPAGEEPVSLYPPRHVAVVAERDVYPDVAGAFERLATEFEEGTNSVVFATGVSATADMGELVEGVHGPREVHVIVVANT
ncbi:LutC/YkgG family protein [Natronobeatus ordinarius]|uniref:LutC/YkgG family protein n=1 Tax=Natronobeatus ordinarius TaxID=2963433 RepID=UPI0020CE5AE7|nr:LUD domain-containing protein [Natronobeatus ordinarius]